MEMLTSQQLELEFDRQVENLLRLGYPKLLQVDEKDFLSEIQKLREKLTNLSVSPLDLSKGTIPFVIVVKSGAFSSEKAMSLTEKDEKNGVTILRPHTSENFQVINDVPIPEGFAYLLLDIDRGKENINLPPNEAMKLIKKANRSPLTIDEGIAVVTHFPEFLMKNNCFSLLASRTGKDQRVPAIWINGRKEPNLGWCWDGNPHTWLGSASAVSRVGV